MAFQCLEKGKHVIGISRKASSALADYAAEKNVSLEQWSYDLANSSPAAERMTTWFDVHLGRRAGISSAILINNACILGEIAPLHKCSQESLILATRVGLEAPMLLMHAFLSGTQTWVDSGWEGERKILNISSGLGRSAMASSGELVCLV